LADIVSSTQRSVIMSKIKSRDTAPELAVRRIAHRLGFRFRLHAKNLPGRPDLIFPKHRLALFVHGCFWHRHRGCRFAYRPKTRVRFWDTKFRSNVARDGKNVNQLEIMGWRVLIVWECEAEHELRLLKLLAAHVPAKRSSSSRRFGVAK
jgi:DNA mismatch endonuclease, patch repair protein